MSRGVKGPEHFPAVLYLNFEGLVPKTCQLVMQQQHQQEDSSSTQIREDIMED